jgi:hypothetical protein
MLKLRKQTPCRRGSEQKLSGGSAREARLTIGGNSQLDDMQMTLCVCWTTLWRRLSLASSSLPLPSGIVNTPSTSKKSTFMGVFWLPRVVMTESTPTDPTWMMLDVVTRIVRGDPAERREIFREPNIYIFFTQS